MCRPASSASTNHRVAVVRCFPGPKPASRFRVFYIPVRKPRNRATPARQLFDPILHLQSLSFLLCLGCASHTLGLFDAPKVLWTLGIYPKLHLNATLVGFVEPRHLTEQPELVTRNHEPNGLLAERALFRRIRNEVDFPYPVVRALVVIAWQLRSSPWRSLNLVVRP